MQANRTCRQPEKQRPGPAPSLNIINRILPPPVTSDTTLFKNASVQALSVLSPGEVRELVICEEIIAKGWDTFVCVGSALAAIRDKRLYRADFDTFEAYCREKWQFGKAYAYRLIGAAEVIASLSPIGDIPLPRNEAQVRPLFGLKAAEAQAIWREVIKKAGKKNVTAALVKEMMKQFRHAANRGRGACARNPTQEQLQQVIVRIEDLLGTLKQRLKAGDLRTSLTLLHQIRGALLL